jgi:hypothetical protein
MRVEPPMGSNLARPNAPSQYWDASKGSVPVQLLRRSFQLAYFLFPDRATAIEIVLRASGRLGSRSLREMKRLYWRDKHWPHHVRRVARTDPDMLQWLTMMESERHEKIQEQAGGSSLEQMAIRYIKYLVQLTTTLSSFHVNVALTRLLHSYSTSEAQRVYERLTGRFLGPDIYRRAKAGLMDNLMERFNGFVKTTRTARGELRFETAADQKRWASLIDRCLKAFTPWSTQGLCPSFSVIVGDNGKLTSQFTIADGDHNEMETRCWHVLIDPVCYHRLLNELSLEPPASKLALPRFFMSEKHDSNCNGTATGTPAELSEEELSRIQQRLAAEDSRRRKMDPEFVTILVDGHERCRLNLTRDKKVNLELEAGTAFVEISAADGADDIVLATHFISYVDEAFEFSKATANLGRGRMEFTVAPTGDVNSYPQRGVVTLRFRPAFQMGRAWTRWRLFLIPGKIRRYAITALALALLGWGAVGAFYAHRTRLLEQQLEQTRRNQQQLAPTVARAVISYMLTQDDQRVRGAGNAAIPEISLRRYPPAVSLELPLAEAPTPGGYKVELRTFTDDQTLMTASSLQAITTDAGPVVEIVFSADLLKPDVYYTVYLYSRDRTDRFTFKAVATE